ncbi:MAG: hypothetical protein IJ808_09275 [Muribaculaceae bacterium]|nr:hypothetical protein [Muribaculaceae bacterium]
MVRLEKIAAWVLLSVFVPMIGLSALHVHPIVEVTNVHCNDCVTHTCHSGHITTLQVHLDDCVLCSFAGNQYVAAEGFKLAACAPQILSLYTPYHASGSSCHLHAIATRGPPQS